MRTDALKLQRHGVVVRDKPEELPARDAEAAHLVARAHLGGGVAVLQQADLAEESSCAHHAAALAALRRLRLTFENDEEVFAVITLLQNDIARLVILDAREFGEALHGLHVPVAAQAEPGEEGQFLNQIGELRQLHPAEEQLVRHRSIHTEQHHRRHRAVHELRMHLVRDGMQTHEIVLLQHLVQHAAARAQLAVDTHAAGKNQ